MSENGEVLTCGSNEYSQLGFKSNEKSINIPRKVEGIKGKIMDIKCSLNTTFLLVK
jgi:alpha-tubulin suppressor-like RCC1 family protein